MTLCLQKYYRTQSVTDRTLLMFVCSFPDSWLRSLLPLAVWQRIRPLLMLSERQTLPCPVLQLSNACSVQLLKCLLRGEVNCLTRLWTN